MGGGSCGDRRDDEYVDEERPTPSFWSYARLCASLLSVAYASLTRWN